MQKRIAGEVVRELRGADVTGWLTGGGNGVEGQFGECDVGGIEAEGTEGGVFNRWRQGEALGRFDG